MDKNSWISVKERLPIYGKGSFLSYWETQHIMLLFFVDIHGNYVLIGGNGDSCGNGDSPKFTHWQPLPAPPTSDNSKSTAPKQASGQSAQTCDWKREDEDNDEYWETSCDNAFTFNAGSPDKNGFSHCPYCGRKLSVT